MYKHTFAILFCFILLINISSIIKINNNTHPVSYVSNSQGYAEIKILESNTLSPVANATVCVIETRKYYTTNKYGTTSKITVPITPNNNFDISLKRTWGEFTILVYKQGFATHISFYNEVYPNTTRVGLICYLSPIINDDDPPITISANCPNYTWAEQLINLYKK